MVIIIILLSNFIVTIVPLTIYIIFVITMASLLPLITKILL